MMFANLDYPQSVNPLALNLSDLRRIDGLTEFGRYHKSSNSFSQEELDSYLTFCQQGFNIDRFQPIFLDIALRVDHQKFPILVELYRREAQAGKVYDFLIPRY